MNNKIEEFLSPNAHKIIDEYMKMYPSLKFSVDVSHRSYMTRTDNMTFEIFVNSSNKDEIEYLFLHEFLHCIQDIEGFSHIYSYNPQKREWANELSSVIKDMDIRKRLKRYGYSDESDKVKQGIALYTTLFTQIMNTHNKTEITSVTDMIDVACMLITADSLNINSKKLVVLLSKTRPRIIKYYTILKNILNKYSYSSASDVKLIFEEIIQKFNLTDLYVSP